MTPPLGASQILATRSALDTCALAFADRAANHDGRLSAEEAARLREVVLARCRKLLDDWQNIADYFRQKNTRLQYQRWEEKGPARLLYDMLDPELEDLTPEQQKFRANRSCAMWSRRWTCSSKTSTIGRQPNEQRPT